MFGIICVIVVAFALAVVLAGGREDDWRDMENEGKDIAK